MGQKLPKTLIYVLAALGVLSFGASLYLELRQLAFLDHHPIMVNLISGFVAFCFGVLALSVGFNWLLEREQAWRSRVSIASAYRSVVLRAQELISTLEAGLRVVRPPGRATGTGPSTWRELLSHLDRDQLDVGGYGWTRQFAIAARRWLQGEVATLRIALRTDVAENDDLGMDHAMECLAELIASPDFQSLRRTLESLHEVASRVTHVSGRTTPQP